MVGALSACGKPEDDGPTVHTVPSALPAYPAWSVGMIGQPLTRVVKGKADCIGVFDALSTKHLGAPPGYEVDGWAWDRTAKRGVQHVLIVGLDDRVLGAADGGVVARPDVPANSPFVTTKFVGWHGVVGATTGTVLAVGLGANGGQCALGKSMKLDATVY